MSVDTKGLVHTPIKDVIHVMSIVNSTLRKLINSKMPEGRPARGWGLHDGFSYPEMTLTSDGQTVYCHFDIAGDGRNLQVAFSCDCDNVDTHPGMKIKFSLGYWGNSIEIMSAVLGRLTHLGPCYIDHNDGDDTGYVPIVAEPMNFIEAVIHGFNSVLNVDDWVRVHASLPDSHKKPLAEFLGLTPEEMAAFEKDRNAIFKICDAYKAAAEPKTVMAA